MLLVFLISVACHFECHSTECRSDECHHANVNYAACHSGRWVM
jgi:hypothetical protein